MTMLSAFAARPLVEMKQRDKSKIESILAYGDRLLVGLNTGSLRIYRINEQADIAEDPADAQGSDEEPAPARVRPVDLMREEEKFAKKPIQQLAIIKEANILVSLSDTYVSLHDLQTYQLQDRLEKSKGATLFSATSNIVKDDSTGIPSIVSRIAVAVKRKILLWSWHDMEFDLEAAEVVLVAAAKSLTWASGTRLVAGLDSGFVVVDIETLAISDIAKPGSLEDASTKFGAVSSSGMGYVGMGSWVPKPMATKLAEGEMLLAKDVNTLFINSDGKALDKRQVPWPTAPDAIGYSYPYMLVLQPPSKGTLEVRNPDTLSLLQSISLPNASLLHVPQPNISLAHAGKGFLVGSDRCIWRMSALNYNSQIEQLTTEGHYDEAISLVSMLEDTLLLDKEVKLRDIKTLKAQTLFNQRKYRESLELFADAPAPPQRVVAMYPKIISGEPSAENDPEDAENGQDEHREERKSPPSSPKSTPRKTMLGRLMPEHKKLDSETSSVKSSRTNDTAEVGSIRGRLSDGSAEKPLEGRDLLVATNELCAFLAQIRVRLQKVINIDGSLIEPLPAHPPEGYRPSFHKLIMLTPDDKPPIDWHAKLLQVATLVYTTLFRAYMFAKPGLAGSLFRLDNFCDPAVVRDKLYETGRYADLIDFLYGKKLHREALDLLVKFGKDVSNEAVIPALRGPRRTVAYLQQLPPEQIDLILEFSEWPLRMDADLGMEVFLADTENAETLPRDRVLGFLQGIGDRLVVKYLQHVIGELNDLTPDFHQRLIDQYIERLKLGRTAKVDYGGFANEDEKNAFKEKLQDFLMSSDQYNLARAFREIPADDADFYESRAIVLSKMGQHKQALQIYVFQLNSPSKAEEYCNQTYLAARPLNDALPGVPGSDAADSSDAPPSIYHTLLSLYLNPPPPHAAQPDAALALLSAHGARLPASQTLALIPPDQRVATLQPYFTGRMRATASRMRLERVEARLRGVRLAGVEARLAAEKGRSVVVTEERLCGVCLKRFGGSAVRVYPDGRVVHYGCFDGVRRERAWG